VIATAGLLAAYDERGDPPPVVRQAGIGLGVRSYAISEHDGRFVLRVSTGVRGKYVWLPLHVPAKFRDRITTAHGDAKLFQRGDDWYLMLPIRISTPPGRSGELTFIGVDRGIVQHAVIAAPDSCRFFSGRAARRKRAHFADLRRRFQKHNRLDRVKRNKGRERAWMRNVNHQISRAVVDFASRYANPVLVLEDLAHIRERVRALKEQRREIHSWAFGQLGEFIEYKARRAGIQVLYVDPRNTSRTCPKCGHVDRANRHGSQFRCTACGHQVHADLAAARNIAAVGASLRRQGPPDTARPKGQTGQPGAQPDGVKGCRVSLQSNSNLSSSACGTSRL
jgi:IS605 OrfB family transposase